MKKHIAKFLKLQGLLIDKVYYEGKNLFVQVRSPLRQARCPFCHSLSKRVYQIRQRNVRHIYTNNELIILKVRQRRFYCKKCGKTFTEKIKGIIKNERVTEIAKQQMVRELANQSFLAVAKKFKIHHSTLIHYLRKEFLVKEIQWPKRGDLYLGIDGHSFKGQEMVNAISENRRKRTLIVLPNDQQITIHNFLAKIPEDIRERIKEICIDMEQGHKAVIQKDLPQAKIVIDHFHVIQYANRTIDRYRTILQSVKKVKIDKKIWLKGREKLNQEELNDLINYSDKYPKLFKLWAEKENLRDLYYVNNKKVASFKLNKIIRNLQEIEAISVQDFVHSLKRWREEILNYFDNHTTNGYLEGMNRKFKLIQRISFGFRNINNYLAKLSLAYLPLFIILKHHHVF
jgi:transposase